MQTRSGARSCVPADETVTSKPQLARGDSLIRQGIAAAHRDACPCERAESLMPVYDEEETIAAATEKVVIKAAMDSGAVANVIHPKELPCDANPEPNTTGHHFVGASNARIEKFGTCTTKLESEHGAIGCNWQLADVTRPLHSVAQVAGPEDGPGKQDVLFSNKICVVVPPGTVEKLLKIIKPVTEYKRQGNLYVGKFTMSSFGRQGASA